MADHSQDLVADGRSGERFDHYMNRCLYGPDGFYSTSGTAGRSRGDFITSPEVGPLFGAVVANALDSWWERLGRPDPFMVYDVGCGPGTLLASIAIAKPDRPWELVGVDTASTSGAARTELPEDLTGAVVIANELLDNLPFRVIVAEEEGIAEVFVDGDPPAERFVPVDTVDVPAGVAVVPADVPPGSVLAAGTLPLGTRVPLLGGANSWLVSVLDRNPAVVHLFDYGAPTTEELATRGGWLRTYRDHQRGSDPLVGPGEWDITTDIAWDQLPPSNRLERQHEFLDRWGIQELVDEGREYWRSHAAHPDLAAIRMRSRISESEALLDLDGLGSWWVATWINEFFESGVVLSG